MILGAASVLGENVYVAALGPNLGTFGFNVKTGKKTFESELGEYNPVISDGERMYLTGSSNIRAFEHETAAEQRRAAHRRQAERQRQQAAHRAKQRAPAGRAPGGQRRAGQEAAERRRLRRSPQRFSSISTNTASPSVELTTSCAVPAIPSRARRPPGSSPAPSRRGP